LVSEDNIIEKAFTKSNKKERVEEKGRSHFMRVWISLVFSHAISKVKSANEPSGPSGWSLSWFL